MPTALLPAFLFAGCCLFTLLLLRTYLPLRTTPEYILAPVFFAVLVPCSVIWLLPIDLASVRGAHGIVLGQKALLIGWRIGYWLCFVLTWAVLPILQSYSDSGYQNPRARLMQSLKANARYQLMMLVTGVVFLIYFVSTSGFSFTSLNALVIAMAHCYALTLAIYLMGHGLVSIPRQLFRDARPAGKLRDLQVRAVGTYDGLIDVTAKLLEVQEEVRMMQGRKHTVVRDLRDWVEELGDIMALPESHLSPRERTMLSHSIHTTNASSPPQIVTEEYLAGLTYRLKNAVDKRTRYLAAWQALLQSASDCQRIVESMPTRQLHSFPQVVVSTKPARLFPERWTLLTPYTRYLLHVYLIPTFRRVAGFFLALASVCVVWSEVISSFFPNLSLLGLTISWGGSTGTVYLQQGIMAMWIAYMTLASLLSLSSVRLWNGYALIPRKTSGGSACFFASYAARLTVPLAYNFMTMLPPDRMLWRESVFYGFLGKSINLTPLGAGFSKFFPMLVLVPVGATAFDWYGRVKQVCGCGEFFDWGDEEEDEEVAVVGGGGRARGAAWAWREGKELIEREIGAAVTCPASSGGFLSGVRRATSTAAGGENRMRVRMENGSITGAGGGAEESEGLLGGWAHRVRNTFETLGGPSAAAAASGSGNAESLGLARPRWMGGAAGGPQQALGVAVAGGDERPSWFRMFTGRGE